MPQCALATAALRSVPLQGEEQAPALPDHRVPQHVVGCLTPVRQAILGACMGLMAAIVHIVLLALLKYHRPEQRCLLSLGLCLEKDRWSVGDSQIVQGSPLVGEASQQ